MYIRPQKPDAPSGPSLFPLTTPVLDKYYQQPEIQQRDQFQSLVIVLRLKRDSGHDAENNT
jgi:hypothetical protein